MNFKSISEEYPLILASASPRRERLLKQIALPFRPIPSRVSEKNVIGEPSKASCLLARKKASKVQKKNKQNWVLGADTVVVLHDSILGKPTDTAEAKEMLNFLSGHDHSVITGFCVLEPSGEIAHIEAVKTIVKVKELTNKEVNEYVATGEPFGKAGSYAIQGIGSFMVEEISGSYTNVVGLPLCALIKALIAVKALARFPL